MSHAYKKRTTNAAIRIQSENTLFFGGCNANTTITNEDKTMDSENIKTPSQKDGLSIAIKTNLTKYNKCVQNKRKNNGNYDR